MTPKDVFSGMAARCPDCRFTSTETPVPPGLPPSQIDELFSCNDAPLDHECAVLEDIVRVSNNYISVLQQRISDTRNTLEALLQEEIRAEKNAAEAKALLNPVRQLSAHVLDEIFTARIHTDTDQLIYTPSGALDSLTTESMRQATRRPISFPHRFALPVEAISQLHAVMAPPHAASLLHWDGAKPVKSACFVTLEHSFILYRLEVSMTRHAYLRSLSVVEQASVSIPGAISDLVSHLRLPALEKMTRKFEGTAVILPTFSQQTAPALTELEVYSYHLVMDGKSLAKMLK
ncbi:hypothetical protein DFS33DRAFT_1376563 [Desarmillaria ectypa]|nr:hypothetical protein DFS33DRAFT_1376563 [Desarmillaria ectypa]